MPILDKRKHLQQDMFIANIVGAKPKDDIHTMEHQMFSLTKRKALKIINYDHNGKHYEITPSVKGHANIWDKDILMYCGSQLMAAINKGEVPNRTVRVNVYDFLVWSNSGTGGKDYINFINSLDRLRGTVIKTNILTGGEHIPKSFGVISEYEVIYFSKNIKTGKENKNSARVVDITLSRWQYNTILSKEMLTISEDYFRISKGVLRALYLHARKHCGAQGKYQIGIEKLHKKILSGSTVPKFRIQIKEVIKKSNLILESHIHN